jgi:hypothetical protein
VVTAFSLTILVGVELAHPLQEVEEGVDVVVALAGVVQI